jgi:hypothetical protein
MRWLHWPNIAADLMLIVLIVMSFMTDRIFADTNLFVYAQSIGIV